ncbi:MAG: hypothetical protein DLM72_18340 [Candidatus Nitrosopolaris wilkensis]|nr:MAG: hypothetical protein DLM72_18340 [Candidatus Nitrosopolaris wilkensis]
MLEIYDVRLIPLLASLQFLMILSSNVLFDMFSTNVTVLHICSYIIGALELPLIGGRRGSWQLQEQVFCVKTSFSVFPSLAFWELGVIYTLEGCELGKKECRGIH